MGGGNVLEEKVFPPELRKYYLCRGKRRLPQKGRNRPGAGGGPAKRTGI